MGFCSRRAAQRTVSRVQRMSQREEVEGGRTGVENVVVERHEVRRGLKEVVVSVEASERESEMGEERRREAESGTNLSVSARTNDS